MDKKVRETQILLAPREHYRQRSVNTIRLQRPSTTQGKLIRNEKTHQGEVKQGNEKARNKSGRHVQHVHMAKTSVPVSCMKMYKAR